MDDYLIFCSGVDIEMVVTLVSEQFELNGGGLNTTKQLPHSDGIQFLDIPSTFQRTTFAGNVLLGLLKQC